MNAIKTYYLIDFENVSCDGLNGCEKLKKSDHIHIFYTNNSKKIDMDIINNHGGAKLTTHKVPAGKQSADMHLGSYLGYLIRAKHVDKKESCRFVVVSKDTGYDPIIQFWKKEKKAKITRTNKISNKQGKTKAKDISPKKEKAKETKQQKIIDISASAKKSKPLQEIEQILNQAGMSKEVVNYVSAVIGINEKSKQRKQDIYKNIVSKYGQETGLKIYTRIKKKI